MNVTLKLLKKCVLPLMSRSDYITRPKLAALRELEKKKNYYAQQKYNQVMRIPRELEKELVALEKVTNSVRLSSNLQALQRNLRRLRHELVTPGRRLTRTLAFKLR